MNVFIHRTIESLAEILPKWKQLKEQFREITIFQELDWLLDWWNHEIKSVEMTPYIVEVKENNETIGIIPLYLTNREFAGMKFRVLIPIGKEEANYLTPILSKKYPPKQILKKAMKRIYKDKSNWDYIHLLKVPEGSNFDIFFKQYLATNNKRVTRRKHEVSAHLPISGDIETVMDNVNKGFLKDVLYAERRIGREGKLKFHRVKDEQEIEPIMNIFFGYHCKRWENTITPSTYEDPTYRKYKLELARQYFHCGLLYLTYLTLDNIVIAINFGMADGQTNWLYVHATNEKYKKFSPGHLLLYHIIQDSHRESYKELDLLSGNIDYKEKWGTINIANCEYSIFNQSMKSSLFRLIHRTYYSKTFLQRPKIQQVIVKVFIRGCAFLVGTYDKFKRNKKPSTPSFDRVY